MQVGYQFGMCRENMQLKVKRLAMKSLVSFVRASVCHGWVCVCVCVCERERGRERGNSHGKQSNLAALPTCEMVFVNFGRNIAQP